jgi:hypothetical protein
MCSPAASGFERRSRGLTEHDAITGEAAEERGYTLFLPERYLQRLEMPVEAAMRMVLTAGMNRSRPALSEARKDVVDGTRV